MSDRLDKGILLAVVFLLGLGLVQVYTASFIYATEVYEDGLFFLRKQFFFFALGLVVLGFCALMPWSTAKRMGLVLWVLAVLGIIATFIPALSIRAGGAHRWLWMPFGQRFEPAELLRITFPIAFAYLLVSDKKLSAQGYLLRAGILLSPMVLLLKQPDFGTFAMCIVVGLALLFTLGLKWRYVFMMAGAITAAFYFLVVNVSYRYSRLQTFLDPWADPAQKGFQVIQSMLSFHSGGLSGAGVGQGQGKLFFLPEAHTDFTMAVLGEELGFLGFAFVLLMYGLLVFRGFQIALHTDHPKDRVIALGLTLMFALAVFINIGVVLGLLPTKGLTLPFLSYGGSSLVCTCMAFGWLLNLNAQKNKRV